MNRPSEKELLDFLEGRLDEPARAAVLEALDADPALGEELRQVAAGLAVMANESAPIPMGAFPPRRSPWPIIAAIAATLALAVPSTVWMVNRTIEPPSLASGQPTDPRPSFVLVLHGRWPDAQTVDPSEAQRRAAEYWGWTSDLAARDLLLAAGDLRWEPGERLGPGGVALTVAATEVEQDTFQVGMITVRVDSYEDALALARECPHLRYGGWVSVRRVGAGFVTATFGGDWGPR